MNGTNEKIAAMTEGGKLLGDILAGLMRKADSGVNVLDLEKHAMEKIRAAGGKPSFPTVEGYKWATCICLNDEVVHGIPSDRVLQPQDVITIDIGMLYKGYHTDTADSKIIGGDENAHPEVVKFLDTGRKTLYEAIRAAQPGNHIGHISAVIEREITSAGYHIVKSLVGHGVGEELHMEPQIPGYVRGAWQNTPRLVEGMTIAIEIIYGENTGNVVYANDDGWTISTRDGSLSAVFEHTVLVGRNGPLVLTESTK